jgi:hypothetical protein
MYWKVQTRIHEQYQMNWRIVSKNSFNFFFCLNIFFFCKAIVHEETTMRRRVFNTWLNRAHSRLIDNEQHVKLKIYFLILNFYFFKDCC